MPGDEKPHSTDDGAAEFEKLRGLLKEALDSLGGEAFLRRERNAFYERDTAKEE